MYDYQKYIEHNFERTRDMKRATIKMQKLIC